MVKKLNETISYEIDLETSTITFTSEKENDEIPRIEFIGG